MRSSLTLFLEQFNLRKVPVDVFSGDRSLCGRLGLPALPGLSGMIEPEHVVLAEDDPVAGAQNDRLEHGAPVDVAQGVGSRRQRDHVVAVLKEAVLVEDVRAAQLDVLRDVGLGRADPRDAVLDVVEQALGHERVLVQVDKVRRLLGREDAHRVAVLLDGDAHLGEHGLPLEPDHFGPLQFLLPSLVQFCSLVHFSLVSPVTYNLSFSLASKLSLFWSFFLVNLVKILSFSRQSWSSN